MNINTTQQQLEKINEEYHYFNKLCNVQTKKTGKLKDYVISVKDALCVKDVETKGGSAILEGYKPLFNATVIEKLLAEGATIIGKTSQDAFGFGTFSTNVGNNMQIPLNPFDKNHSTGGSSGGAAGFTQLAKKKGIKHIALGESTGGSIAAPASFCGVYGLTPTYSLVSRYGLLDYANSLDKIGPIAASVKELAMCLSIIAGHDEKDATSSKTSIPDYEKGLSKPIKGMKIAVIKECFGKGIDPAIKQNILETIETLKKQGATIEEISLPTTTEYALEAYYILAMCEASTNLAKYCGIRYGRHEKLEGNFNQYFSKVRSHGFNKEEKRRILLGTFARMSGYRDAYYIKAAKVRTLIIQEYKKAFEKYDILISPTMPMVAPTFDEIKRLTPLQHYMVDLMTVGPSLAGLPHISCPTGFKDNMPIGTMFIADHFQEEKLLQIASSIEELNHG
ncbi:Asp-tRNA(Asn)/Glu-tRNA(Gln) amidotransferase subunit GatA [Candidatus Woesearchaeota archaeon]|nr:Asp-tRNA(Asn)/Glu-tRNA(Gln) amidotransferase subunit GatA [Candidatus Woesearchaeota archaeon]